MTVTKFKNEWWPDVNFFIYIIITITLWHQRATVHLVLADSYSHRHDIDYKPVMD